MSVPPRWRNCPRKGKVIANKFLPFKCPLSTEYDRDLDECQRFHPSMLVSYTESVERRMGLVVDLTKTDRYYDKRELLQSGIGHHKIICAGYSAAPTTEQVRSFRAVCKQFFSEHPGDIIGVHCTHGYNRTGFLIIAYLIEEEYWDLEAAVATFSFARPPGIYKEHYLRDLAQRYTEGDMGDIQVPSLPDWCFDEEEGDSGGEGGGEGEVRQQNDRRKPKKEIDNENAQFAVAVPGVDVVWGKERKDVQETCQKILHWESSGFPGCQPVSMDVQNIRFINEKPYRVSWKADGTRYFLYIHDKGQVYMVDRDNSVFSAPSLKFFSRKREGEHLKDCLADAELVVDKDKHTGHERPRLLIYDMIQFEGKSDVGKCDHPTRLLCIEKELILPREEAMKKQLLNKALEPFSVRAKQFWDVASTREILEKWIPGLTHECDGLIFSPHQDPYTPGRCDNVLKWKYEQLNSVDFLLSIVNRPAQEGMLPEKIGQLFVGSGSKRVQFSQIDLRKNKEVNHHNGRIIECTFDRETQQWKFLRLREDKSFPNAYDTAKNVFQSILQPVTKDWLLQVCEKHRWRAPTEDTGNNRKRTSDSVAMPPPKHRPPQQS